MHLEEVQKQATIEMTAQGQPPMPPEGGGGPMPPGPGGPAPVQA